MNEEIYPKNQNPQIQDIPSVVSLPQSSVKPSYKANNWIALVYVVIITITWFNDDPVLSGILFLVTLVMGLIVAGSFINRINKANKNTQNKLVKVFFSLVGVGGGMVIFIIAFISGLVGWLNTHPIRGD
jgi:hypothetical protein